MKSYRSLFFAAGLLGGLSLLATVACRTESAGLTKDRLAATLAEETGVPAAEFNALAGGGQLQSNTLTAILLKGQDQACLEKTHASGELEPASPTVNAADFVAFFQQQTGATKTFFLPRYLTGIKWSLWGQTLVIQAEYRIPGLYRASFLALGTYAGHQPTIDTIVFKAAQVYLLKLPKPGWVGLFELPSPATPSPIQGSGANLP